MYSLDTHKHTPAPWTRRAFGMFAIVSLLLALQPCAMAMDGEQDHDCPHCPPSESQGHHGHHGSSAGGLDESPCASATNDCSLGDDLNHDGRNAKAKLEDLPKDGAIAVVDLFDTAAVIRFVDPRGVCPTRSPPPGSSPPLNVLYCVYLD